MEKIIIVKKEERTIAVLMTDTHNTHVWDNVKGVSLYTENSCLEN